MKGINHFIIKVEEAFKDKIAVGSTELFIDTKIHRDRSSNRFGTVVSSPVFGEYKELTEGTEVVIDATALYRQIYRDVEQESVHLVDKEKGYYKLEPEMIVLYKPSPESEWEGYGDNLMISLIEREAKTTTSGIVLEVLKETHEKGKAIVKYGNSFLKEQEVENGQEVFINLLHAVPFFFKKETLYWVRSKDILAV